MNRRWSSYGLQVGGAGLGLFWFVADKREMDIPDRLLDALLIISILLFLIGVVLCFLGRKDSINNSVHTSTAALKPAPDVPLCQVAYFITTGTWKARPPVDIEGTEFESGLLDALDDINRQILAGNLTIWGRAGYFEPQTPVDPKFWSRRDLDWEQACRGHDDAMYIQTPLDALLDDDHYVQLFTSKSQAKGIWPPENI